MWKHQYFILLEFPSDQKDHQKEEISTSCSSRCRPAFEILKKEFLHFKSTTERKGPRSDLSKALSSHADTLQILKPTVYMDNNNCACQCDYKNKKKQSDLFKDLANASLSSLSFITTKVENPLLQDQFLAEIVDTIRDCSVRDAVCLWVIINNEHLIISSHVNQGSIINLMSLNQSFTQAPINFHLEVDIFMHTVRQAFAVQYPEHAKILTIDSKSGRRDTQYPGISLPDSICSNRSSSSPRTKEEWPHLIKKCDWFSVCIDNTKKQHYLHYLYT